MNIMIHRGTRGENGINISKFIGKRKIFSVDSRSMDSNVVCTLYLKGLHNYIEQKICFTTGIKYKKSMNEPSCFVCYKIA